MSTTILSVLEAAGRRREVSTALKAAGYEVIESAGSVVALQVLRILRVDLVIADVDMVPMDGIAFVRHLRALPGFGRTPVLLLATATSREMTASECQADVWGWLARPFSGCQLQAVVAGILEKQSIVKSPPAGACDEQTADLVAAL